METVSNLEGVGAPFTADNGLLSDHRFCYSVTALHCNSVNSVNTVNAAILASMVDNGASAFEHTASVRDGSEVDR